MDKRKVYGIFDEICNEFSIEETQKLVELLQDVMKEEDWNVFKHLANNFCKENNYTPEYIKGVDVSNELEGEVCDWIDDISGTLMNYVEYEWIYKDKVYSYVCEMLGV